MESRIPSQLGGARRTGVTRRPSVVALAAALLFATLFVDVGVAHAEYPAGWEDPDLAVLGACVGTCGSLILMKGAVAKYSFGAGCLACVWQIAVELNDYFNSINEVGDCYTGMLGMPCDGTREWYP
jgi:hypothetical protein